jgi:hypothetical protein
MASEKNLAIEPLKNAVNALEASIGDYDEYFSKGGTLKILSVRA